jgi:spore maturation protein CgeB
LYLTSQELESLIKEFLKLSVVDALYNNQEVNELFKDGKHLMTYINLDELFGKLEVLLTQTDKRLKIASLGYEVLEKHTIFQSRGSFKGL